MASVSNAPVISETEVESLLRVQVSKGKSLDQVVDILQKGAESGRIVRGRRLTPEVISKVHLRLKQETHERVATSAQTSAAKVTSSEPSQEPSAKVPKTHEAATPGSVRTDVEVITPIMPEVVSVQVPEVELVCIGDGDLCHKMYPPPGGMLAFQKRQEEQNKTDDMLRAVKEERMVEIFKSMDDQMRGWCRQLAKQKCKGAPWRNVGANKLKVLTEPKLDGRTFEGEYVPPGSTFGVEEERISPDGRKWLRLASGGWVSDRSRKQTREAIVVAERVEKHQEEVGEEAFEIGVHEDRRQAYMRMVHRRVENELQIPEGLKVELMPYQIEGVEWLVSLFNNDLAGLLADEMGLGKTIQTLALMAFLKETKKRYGPHLIICPKSVVNNWHKEINQCFPEYAEHAVLFQGTPLEREEHAKRIRKIMKKSRQKLVIITNYEQVHPDRNEVLKEPKYELIVIDEGHRMKNQKSVFHQTMKDHFRARMKLLLTGTPLQNNLDELFSLLSYLLPEVFTNASSFKSWFAAPFLGKLESMNMNEYFLDFTEEEETSLISNLHAMLAPFVLQRTKADVLKSESLLPRREVIIRAPLSAWQERTYQDLKEATLRRLSVEGGEVSHNLVRNTTMQLRKIVLHPYLFGRGVGERKLEDLVRASGKLEVLDRLLQKMHRHGHRVLIFSQFTSMLDVLEELLRLRSWSFERIDGQVSSEERQERINRFSEPKGAAFIFLLSSRAGAVGLNLQAADTVVLFDLDWNPQNDKQAIARAHRMGQTKEVLVVRLLTTSPIEQHMERSVEKKLDLERKIIGAGGFSRKGNTKTPEERAELLKELLGTATTAASTDEVFATQLHDANVSLARGDELAGFEALDQALGIAGCDRESLEKCGRLMAADEVPEGFEAEDETSDSE